MTDRRPRLAEIGLPPAFGDSAIRPELPAQRYAERIEQLRARMAGRELDLLIVWADREHSAGLSFLSGFDPRFEEAILVVGADGDPAILVGNECWGTAGAAPLAMRRILFQDLSLPSQPRDRSRPLADHPGRRAASSPAPGSASSAGRHTPSGRPIEAPAFLVDELRRLVGPDGLVESASDLLIDPADGLRIVNDVDQLAALESASTRTSEGLRRLITGLRPGLTEREAVQLLRVGRDAAVVPPDADRGSARDVRPAQPGRPGRSSTATASRSRSGSGAP